MPGSERWAKRVTSALLLIATLLGAVRQTAAQGAVEDWSAQVILSAEGVDSAQPAIVADPSGAVHVVWASKLDAESGCSYDTLMYARAEGNAWSSPVEVLLSPNGKCVSGPTVGFAPSAGRVHVVWSDLYVLYHSSARADRAGDPRAWTKPAPVGLTNARRPHLAIDAAGRLHVGCYRAQPDWEVAYDWSGDGGETWLLGHRIAAAAPDRRVERVELAAAGGRLHIVWTEEFLDGTFDVNVSRGGAVFYARSADGGATWSQPLSVDAKDERYRQDYGAGEIAVATVGAEEVHLVWAGAPAGHRWHQWSSDGGATWREARLVAPVDALGDVGLRFFNDGLDLAADSGARIHLLSSGDRLVHAIWERDRWSALDVMLDYNPVWCRMAVGNGNRLHVVGATTRAERAEISETGSGAHVVKSVWYMGAETAAPRVPFQPLAPADVSQTDSKEDTNTAAPTRPATRQPPPLSAGDASSLKERDDGVSALAPVLLGAASAAALLVAVATVHWLRRRTR